MNLLLLLVQVALASPAQPEQRVSTPNVLLIVIDDVGHELVDTASDAGCLPHISQFAAESTTYSNFWSSPRCSPTRASILTGMDPMRHGFGHIANNSWLPFHKLPYFMS